MIGVHPDALSPDGNADGLKGLCVIDGGIDVPWTLAAELDVGDDKATPATPVHCAGVGVYPPAPGGGHGPVTVTVDPAMVIVCPPGTAIVSGGIVNVCFSTVIGKTVVPVAA